MGTRGAFGFHINGQDKVTYNHFDSYPSGLGYDLVKCLIHQEASELRKVANGIVLVKENDKPSDVQQFECKEYYDGNVASMSKTDWYCLLRKAQGSLNPWTKDGLRYMIDSQIFLKDSLFCEYAYIVNLDSGYFEIYKGFNKGRKGSGRYAKKYLKDNNGYYGVTLVKEIKLDLILKDLIKTEAMFEGVDD